MLDANEIGCEVFPMCWLGGDKSTMCVESQGLNFSVDTMDVKATLEQR